MSVSSCGGEVVEKRKKREEERRVSLDNNVKGTVGRMEKTKLGC